MLDTLIAFAAKAGSTALDGDAKNSPFTAALLKHLATPGLDLRIAFGQVRDDVLKATSNKQEPFVYGSLGGTTVSLVPAQEPKVATPSAAPAATTDSVSDARRDYYEFLNSGATKEGWNDFLQLHPTGPYANLARSQLAKLTDAEKRAADEAKAAEKAAIEKAAAQRAADQKKAAAEKAEAEKAAKKAEADRLAAEKAMAEKAVAEKDTADKTAAPAPQSAKGVAAEKAKVEVAAVSPDTSSQTTKPTLPGPTKKITTQDKTPPTRIKVATRNVEKEDQPSSRRATPTANLPTVDTCTRHLTVCRKGRAQNIKMGLRRPSPYGTCEQRQTICLSTGRWTGKSGTIYSVTRR
jgi:hypothetical protein